MRRSLKACLSLFKIKSLESIQYRIAALASGSIGVFWGLIEIVIFIIFYKYGNNEAGRINGLTITEVISYVWIAQALIPLQPMSIDGEILIKITNGDVGIELCRPLDLYFHWFSKTAAGRLGGFWWRAIIVIAVGLLLPESLRLNGPSSITGFIFFLISTVSAFLLCTSYGMFMSSVRLGITWGEGPTYILMLIGGVLSGGYLPLQLWPDFLQGFLLIQPFAGYLDIPARLYIGSMDVSKATSAIMLQICWGIIFIISGRILMKHKLKNVIVQGG